MNSFLVGVDDNYDFVVDGGKFIWMVYLNWFIELVVLFMMDVWELVEEVNDFLVIKFFVFCDFF